MEAWKGGVTEKPRVALQGAQGQRRRLQYNHSCCLWLRRAGETQLASSSLPLSSRAVCVCKPRMLAASNSIGCAQPSVRWGDLLNLRVQCNMEMDGGCRLGGPRLPARPNVRTQALRTDAGVGAAACARSVRAPGRLVGCKVRAAQRLVLFRPTYPHRGR